MGVSGQGGGGSGWGVGVTPARTALVNLDSSALREGAGEWGVDIRLQASARVDLWI
jgi:hypothetical protein